MTATQITWHQPLLNPPAGGEPTGGQAHVILGAHLRTPTPGWGPGNAIPGDVSVLVFILIIVDTGNALSLTRHLGPVCLGRPYQGH